MYALLVAAARGEPLPPDRFARRLAGRSTPRIAGVGVQLLFGAAWGAAAGAWASRHAFVLGSAMITGLLWGLVAFLASLAGFLALGILERPLDWRAWIGHFLNHLAFGLVLGAGLLAASLAA